MRHYCTYFDHHYLPQGLALYQSLCHHAGDFRLTVLALDRECERQLRCIGFDRIKILPLKKLLHHRPALKQAKKSRSKIEFYFTCTASLMAFIIEKVKEGDTVTYLDADCFFFSSPEIIHEMEEEASIAITPHRFPERLQDRNVYGKFNVGWVTFRRDKTGCACILDWEKCCLEWCFDRLEGEKFGDQKYLDAWPLRYQKIRILNHPGVNCAPWNVEGCDLEFSKEQYKVNSGPLIFYHFHGLKWVAPNMFQANFGEFIKYPPKKLADLYITYLQTLLSLKRKYIPTYRQGRQMRDYEMKTKPTRGFLGKKPRIIQFQESNPWGLESRKRNILEL